MFRALFLCVCAAVASCDPRAESETGADPIFQGGGGPAAGGPGEEDPSAIERLGLGWVARRSYRVEVRVAFVDFASRSAEAESWVAGLSSGLASSWGERVRFAIERVDASWTTPLFEATAFWDLPEPLLREIDQGEPDRVVVFRFTRTRAQTVLSVREIDPRDGLLSAVGHESSASLIDLFQAAMRTFEALFGQEGFLIEKAASGEWSVLFRGAAIADGGTGLAPGTILEVHKLVLARGGGVSYPAIPGAYLRLERIGFSGGMLQASGRPLGGPTPSPGDKVLRVYLPGGSRRVRLVDAEDRPLEGYSIFLSREGFSTEANHFVALSDPRGEVALEDAAGRLGHLTVMKTVRGTPYVFHRRVLHVGEGLPAIRLVLPRVDRQLEEKAGEIAKRRVSEDELGNRKRRASMYLGEAELYIRQGEYRPAQDALRKGIELLETLDDPEVVRLRNALLELRQRFEGEVIRDEEKKNLEEGKALVEKADRAVLAGEFDAASRLLERAASLWPRRPFPEAGRDLDARAARVRDLVREQDGPLGQARRVLLVRVPRLDPEVVDDEFLGQAKDSVVRLSKEGLLDAGSFYSDLEFLLFAKRSLDELAQRIGSRAARAQREYEEEEEVVARQNLYDAHRKFLETSRKIDELLRAFPQAAREKG